MRRRSTPPAPLPQRHGIDPVWLRLPTDGAWETVRDYLVYRYPSVGTAGVDGLFARQTVYGPDGPLDEGAPYRPGEYVWFQREIAEEPVVPFPLHITHRDSRLLVADKPHFLATTPRGSHITQTALALLREQLGLPELSPAHRLDRLTAGLVLFTLRREDRGAYQGLFERRAVHKEYEAVAVHDPGLRLPVTVRSRIEKVRGVVAAREVPGEPNSESRIEILEHRAGLARYRLVPSTGRTHQLRVHMNSLGIPILGDPLYPTVTDPAPDDYRRPLQLLARSLEFTDPLTGEGRHFVSGRSLESFSRYESWAQGTQP